MKAIVVRRGERPVVEEVGEELEAMQAVVGGYIQEIMPWEDEVALVCNEEGKLNGWPVNRFLVDERGNVLDAICGTFFLCYAPMESETFLSMPENLIEKYMRLF